MSKSLYAKPSGQYTRNSVEANNNILCISEFFTPRGYTKESQAAIAGNSFAESGLNPWRWQKDTYNRSGGYGLFQYTPASDYLDKNKTVPNYAPNLSTTTITTGAKPSDGYAQMYVFAEQTQPRWISKCWRNYWDAEAFPELFARRQHILNTYGNGTSLPFTAFKTINDLGDATFAFLACFEGPASPGGFSVRQMYAAWALDVINSAPGTGIPPWLLYKFKR